MPVGGCCSAYASNGPALYGGTGTAGCDCTDDQLMAGTCPADVRDYRGCTGTDQWDLIWSNHQNWTNDYNDFPYHGHTDWLWMDADTGNYSDWGGPYTWVLYTYSRENNFY